MIRLFLLLLIALPLTSPAGAQWPPDPDLNLALADRPSEQVVPKVACTPDGGCYVAWFDLASGSYQVYLQRLDAGGYEQWPHNGILISGHPQLTWLTDWDMIAASDGSAVLVFCDARGGEDLDVHAYRVAPDGELLWGADGVTLSTNDDYEPTPCVTEADDGDFVFAWARMPETGDGHVMLQRLTPEGSERYPHGGLAVAGDPGETPGFQDITPGDEGSILLSWVRDISTFYSPRHVRVDKFSPAGTSLWGGSVTVFDATSVPIAHTPRIQSDAAGGAVVLWHRSAGNLYNSLIQHLDANGGELCPHNGAVVSTTPNRHHLDPSLAYLPETGESIVFWNERNEGQTQWGLCGQKLAPDGSRLWGDGGITYIPIGTLHMYGPRVVRAAEGAMVFLIDEPDQDRVRGWRVDGSGGLVWPEPVTVSSAPGNKSRLPISLGPDGSVILVWEDDRSGTIDVYGQRINADGTLGAASGSVPGAWIGGPMLGGISRPNPAHGTTSFTFQLPVSLRAAELRVFDAGGRLIHSRTLGDLPAGVQTFHWGGADRRTQPAAAGVYFYQLLHLKGSSAPQRFVLTR